MNKAAVLLIIFLSLPVIAADKEKSLITVKDTQVNNGVVIVNVRVAGKAHELQCNKEIADCKVPEPGDYWMVRLPKNWGIYDCANVDLYSQALDPESDKKFGEYCFLEK
ncbi:MAG TPA: hypothetical protein VFA89_16375 [Terriglobales bacterium]|nr:hypothetical protein [Terriglobales bacterium]